VLIIRKYKEKQAQAEGIYGNCLLSVPFFCKSKIKGSLGACGSAWNPSYSGGRDQEDFSSKPAIGIVVETLS
jgi:hypothetical protein